MGITSSLSIPNTQIKNFIDINKQKKQFINSLENEKIFTKELRISNSRQPKLTDSNSNSNSNEDIFVVSIDIYKIVSTIKCRLKLKIGLINKGNELMQILNKINIDIPTNIKNSNKHYNVYNNKDQGNVIDFMLLYTTNLVKTKPFNVGYKTFAKKNIFFTIYCIYYDEFLLKYQNELSNEESYEVMRKKTRIFYTSNPDQIQINFEILKKFNSFIEEKINNTNLVLYKSTNFENINFKLKYDDDDEDEDDDNITNLSIIIKYYKREKKFLF